MLVVVAAEVVVVSWVVVTVVYGDEVVVFRQGPHRPVLQRSPVHQHL